MRRGEIWWADLGEPIGSSPGYRRPVLIIQSDLFNRSKLETVTIVTLTSNLALSEAPGNLLLDRRQTGLPRDSVMNASTVTTIDRQTLLERAGKLSPQIMAVVDEGIKLALNLD